MFTLHRKTLVLACLTCLLGTGVASAQSWRLGVKIDSNAGSGVRILEVFPNSPAEKIGLQPDQVILSVDGELYNDPFLIREKIMFNSGDQIKLVVFEAGSMYEVSCDFSVTTATVMVPGPNGKMIKKVNQTFKVNQLKKVKVNDPRGTGKSVKPGSMKPGDTRPSNNSTSGRPGWNKIG